MPAIVQRYSKQANTATSDIRNLSIPAFQYGRGVLDQPPRILKDNYIYSNRKLEHRHKFLPRAFHLADT